MSPRRATVRTSLTLCEHCASWFEALQTTPPNPQPSDPNRHHHSQDNIRRIKVRIADLGGGDLILLNRTLYTPNPSPCSLCDTFVHSHRLAALETRTTLANLKA